MGHLLDFRNLYPKSLIPMGNQDRESFLSKEGPKSANASKWLTAYLWRDGKRNYGWKVVVFPADEKGHFVGNKPYFDSRSPTSLDKAKETMSKVELSIFHDGLSDFVRNYTEERTSRAQSPLGGLEMLHVVVCIKQVPDSREIRIDPKNNTLIRQGVPSIVNFYDKHGLEEALRIKEQHGARVTVITMGPPPAVKALKECIALGADEAVLVTDRAFAGADTLATSYVLANAIRKAEQLWGPAQIVFCGKQTLDGDTGQVGPGIACRLDFEQLTYVSKVAKVDPAARKVTVHRHLEDGIEIVETRMPVLITALKELNQVRRASMPGLIRAARYEPTVWTTADFPELDKAKIGLKGSPTIVSKTWVPEQRKINTEFLDGESPVAIVEQLAGKLAGGALADRFA